MWSSGGVFIELMIHQIDECCWIKDAWPVSAHGVGGRFPGSTDCSQNLDTYSIEYTFADGTKALVTGRYIPNCQPTSPPSSTARSARRSSPATSTRPPS